MQSNLQSIENEVKNLQKRIFYFYLICCFDAVVSSLLLSFYVFSLKDIFYLTSEDSIRLLSLAIIGVGRALAVYIANDVFLLELLNEKQTEYEITTLINDRSQKDLTAKYKIILLWTSFLLVTGISVGIFVFYFVETYNHPENYQHSLIIFSLFVCVSFLARVILSTVNRFKDKL